MIDTITSYKFPSLVLVGSFFVTLVACQPANDETTDEETTALEQLEIDVAEGRVDLHEIEEIEPPEIGELNTVEELLNAERMYRAAPLAEDEEAFVITGSRIGGVNAYSEAAVALPSAPQANLSVSRYSSFDQNDRMGVNERRRAALSGENYDDTEPGRFLVVSEEPVSTFSADVDTASYANMRRMLEDGVLPPRGSLRTEELVNYFSYDYPYPEDRARPFEPTVWVTPTPWNGETQLVHVGIRGFDDIKTEQPFLNLVFLIDVSGSMGGQDKLDLVQQSLRLLVNEMRPLDRIGIVVYAGRSAVELEPTEARHRDVILGAIDRLTSGGSTAGAEGLNTAYNLAQSHFDETRVNRVILATDGDFNVGVSREDSLADFISQKRETGIYFTYLGFGTGNYNDVMAQSLAQAGNGNAAYIDSLSEARKVLVDEMRATLFPIANDVKFQIEFNPAEVAEYRLVGYETRMLNREDFNNDEVDAGDMGAGHTVTAIYEIVPMGSAAAHYEPLRYQRSVIDGYEITRQPADGGDHLDGIGDIEVDPVFVTVEGEATPPVDTSGELAFLRMRYKLPGEDDSNLIERAIMVSDALDSLDSATHDARFAAAVAAFGQYLRNDPYLPDYTMDDILTLAQSGRGEDEFGYRAEFIQLLRIAQSLEGGRPDKS